MLKKLKDFFKENKEKNWELILSLLFWSYVFLLFFSYAIPGIFSDSFSFYWVLFFFLLVLFFKEGDQEKSVCSKIILQNSDLILSFVIFSFCCLIFLDWWAVGFWTAVFLSFISFLVVFFFSFLWQKYF